MVELGLLRHNCRRDKRGANWASRETTKGFFFRNLGL